MRLRTFFLMLALVMTGAASVNAQVNIGSVDDPHKGAILDLSRNTSEFGVLFPKVHLFSTEALQLQADEGVSATGMVVYNINADLPDGTGLYAWNGSKWESMRNDVNICASVKATAESKKVESTKNVEITVTVTSGNPTYNYIWTKNGTIVWLNVNTNAASDSYVTTGEGNYAVTVTNPCTSKPVTFAFTVDEDGEILIDNGNGTYTDKDGNLVYEGNTYKPVESDLPGIYLKITEDEGDILVYAGADGIPENGDDDNAFVVPDYPLRKQKTEFSVKYPVIYHQNSEYPIELDFADGRTYPGGDNIYNGQIKFISNNPDLLEIDDNGVISVGSAQTSVTYAVILEDGSVTSVATTIRPKNTVNDNKITAVRNSDVILLEESIRKISTTGQKKDGGDAENVATMIYTMDNAAGTGSTVTPGGWFQAGTPGVVTVTATATDDEGTEFTGTITVTITGTPTAESLPYETVSTEWTTLVPAPAYAGGDGTEANPYKISSVRQFKKLATDITLLGTADATYQKYFELTTDLDFAGDETVNSTLIGFFYGTFDGKGHVIRDLTIDATGKNGVSLFGTLSYGEIKNLGREGGLTFGDDAIGIGGLVYALQNGILSNCYNSSSFNVLRAVGGLVFNASGSSTIRNCYNTGDITASGAVNGGLAATCLYGGGSVSIINSYNTGNVSGTRDSGGIIGLINGSLGNKQTLNISRSFNFGEVIISDNNNRAGAFIGSFTEWNSALVEINATNVYSKPGVVSNSEGTVQNQPVGWQNQSTETLKNAILAVNPAMGEDPKYTLEYSQSVDFVNKDLGTAFMHASGRTPKLTWE